MKKTIFIIILILFSGCSVKSYNRTVVYPSHKNKVHYHSISTYGDDKCDCDCNDIYSCDYDPFCDCTRGMYLQDDVGW